MKTKTVPVFTVLFLLMLYLLQGVIVGFTAALPLYLDSRGAKWQEQGTFNFAFYPFSLKLSWAPLLDAIYISRFGRRKTWLVPIQLAIGITLIILSFSLTQLIVHLRIQLLTCIFFFVYFLLATHDTCIDGWSLTLLAKYNLQWASTCQTVGQTTGRFVGFTLLMILESSDFTNRYVRRPLSLAEQPHGLFSMDQFVRSCGVAFLIMAACISLSKKSKKEDKYMSLSQTYLSLVKLLKKDCIQRLAILLLTSPIGYAATYTMTNLVLKRHGVPKETLGLLGVPLILVKILIPLSMTQTNQPLTWFSRSYVPRLIMSVVIAVYVCLTPYLLSEWYFYPILIALFLLNESLIYLMIATRVGFFARICDPCIGGTYITFLNTLGNLGGSLMATAVLYLAGCIQPDEMAYPLLVAICVVLGVAWFTVHCRTMKHLQSLPLEEWHLSPIRRESNRSDSDVGKVRLIE